jgi:hypothetical protein
MTQLRVRWLRLPAIGGLLGITGLIGLRRLTRRASRPRPTGDELMRMSDTEFATFVRVSDIQTVTTAGLAVQDGPAD